LRRPSAAFESAQRIGFFAATAIGRTKDLDAQLQSANPSSDGLKILVSHPFMKPRKLSDFGFTTARLH
jgi:hypothetical protein